MVEPREHFCVISPRGTIFNSQEQVDEVTTRAKPETVERFIGLTIGEECTLMKLPREGRVAELIKLRQAEVDKFTEYLSEAATARTEAVEQLTGG